MKTKIIDVILITIGILLLGGLLIFGIYESKTYVEPEETTTSTTTYKYSNYETELAVFHGGSGEVTYNTYIYKINSGHANMGYKYRNETCTTKSWGSSEWNCHDVKTGQFTWTDEAFTIAKNHGAYSYVTQPNDSKTYTINEFEKIFMKD